MSPFSIFMSLPKQTAVSFELQINESWEQLDNIDKELASNKNPAIAE